MKHILYLLLISFFIFGISCTGDEECRKDKYVKMGVGFYARTLSTTTNKYTVSSLSIDSLSVQGIDTAGLLKDSFIYNKSKKISKIYLPLNKFVEVSRFQVEFNKTVDTVTITHTNSVMYLSLECGCLKVHSIDTVLTTNHFIDSVSIKIHNVNNINAEHLQIYNKPSS
ncbi:MAG: DUF6452 family protein [Paludibacter sp.]